MALDSPFTLSGEEVLPPCPTRQSLVIRVDETTGAKVHLKFHGTADSDFGDMVLYEKECIELDYQSAGQGVSLYPVAGTPGIYWYFKPRD